MQVAQGERLEFGSDKFVECEEVGVRESCRAAFVLVAGGFAERLRLNGGIKVEYLTLVKSNSFESQFFQKTHDNRRIACRVRNLVAASISLASYYPLTIILHHAQKRNCVDGQLEMPVESTTGTCFLELYIQNILALQEASAGQSISDFSSVLVLTKCSVDSSKTVQVGSSIT